MSPARQTPPMIGPPRVPADDIDLGQAQFLLRGRVALGGKLAQNRAISRNTSAA